MPTDYLEWVLRNLYTLNRRERSAIEREYYSRVFPGVPLDFMAAEPEPPPPPPPPDPSIPLSVLAQWMRRELMQAHPQRNGGTPEATAHFQTLNNAFERLAVLLKPYRT